MSWCAGIAECGQCSPPGRKGATLLTNVNSAGAIAITMNFNPQQAAAMHTTPEIALRGIPASAALERYIGDEARKLDGICDRIRNCLVVAEALRRGGRHDAQFAVRLIITLPGMEVAVNREHDDDVYMALRDAFAAAGLQLRDHMRRRGAKQRTRNEAPDSRH